MRSVLYTGLALALSAVCTFGAEATTTFDVTATVLEKCSVSATNLGFGNYDPTSGTPTDAGSTISVDCTLLTDYSVALGVGLGSGAAYSTGRKMQGDSNASQLLTYNLYTDSGRTTVWGDGSDSSVDVDGIGAGLLGPTEYTVYGRIGTGLYAQPQDYSDTIEVTVTY